ncbi:hypothetical protein C8Q74DRAFT_1372017 [Fomes fomentarius]|nr:hypothetical protein C8Q74DRAFT_1372017 [Fomes fomentarius]
MGLKRSSNAPPISSQPLVAPLCSPLDMPGSSEASLSKLGSPVSEKIVDDALPSVVGGEAPYMGRGKHMRRAWLKMDLLALPIIVISYVLNVLDKANIGNARVAGLQDKLQIDDIQFSLALTTTLMQVFHNFSV